MFVTSRSRARVAAFVLLAGLVAAACGEGAGGPGDVAAVTVPAADVPAADLPAADLPAADFPAADLPAADVPAVDVVVLSTGETVDLRSLATAGRPALLWFWAPHCVFCRDEAPDLLRFAADHGGEIDIVGVGAQDTLAQAHGFVDDTDTGGLTMAWDRSGRSWVHYGVTNQPTIKVLSADGRITGTWFRDFDADGILAAAGVA